MVGSKDHRTAPGYVLASCHFRPAETVQHGPDHKMSAHAVHDGSRQAHRQCLHQLGDTVYVTVENTRAALVRAGVELLEETGSPDVGLRSIARRAGVSHGAPRRWFPTHRLLLAAIAEVGLQDLADALESAARASDHDLVEIGRAYVDFARRRPAMFTLIFRHDLLEDSGANLRSSSRPIFAWLVSIVEKSGGTTEPEATAASIWVAIHGLAVLFSTGALELTIPGVDVVDMIRRAVHSSGGWL